MGQNIIAMLKIISVKSKVLQARLQLFTRGNMIDMVVDQPQMFSYYKKIISKYFKQNTLIFLEGLTFHFRSVTDLP